MSTLLHGLRCTARKLRSTPIVQRCSTKPIGMRRPFSTTIPMQDHEPEDANLSFARKKTHSHGGRRLEEEMEMMFEEQQHDELADEDDAMNQIENLMGDWDEEFEKLSEPPPERGKKSVVDTFHNYGEPNDEDEPMELDGEANESSDLYDNLSVLAHGELQQHQEIRHYARLAAWDMPMLSKLAKPFEAPTLDMPLRFRYTTYMGEAHPAEKKIVMEFCISDMPGLTQVQKDKLKKLAGVRYNPESDIVKMSCEMYESQAQNKRYLGDRVDELVKEAKDPKETFEDIPLNLKHHHFKTRPKWPKHWTLTPERKAELAAYRQTSVSSDQQKMLDGLLIDGNTTITEAIQQKSASTSAVPEMVMASRGKPGRVVSVKR